MARVHPSGPLPLAALLLRLGLDAEAGNEYAVAAGRDELLARFRIRVRVPHVVLERFRAVQAGRATCVRCGALLAPARVASVLAARCASCSGCAELAPPAPAVVP